jgi:hypothetical protein
MCSTVRGVMTCIVDLTPGSSSLASRAGGEGMLVGLMQNDGWP